MLFAVTFVLVRGNMTGHRIGHLSYILMLIPTIPKASVLCKKGKYCLYFLLTQ